MEKPHLTPMERVTLETLASMRTERGSELSMADIAARLRLARSGVQRHLQALKTKGAITGPQWVGSWELTPLGKKLQREA